MVFRRQMPTSLLATLLGRASWWPAKPWLGDEKDGAEEEPALEVSPLRE